MKRGSPYPRRPEAWRRRLERMKPLGYMGSIPVILVSESKLNLTAWYGGYWRAAVALIVEGTYYFWIGFYWGLVFRISDWVGWTKLRPIPGTPHKERHSGKCEYLNCNDSFCHSKDIPRWYKRLTGASEAADELREIVETEKKHGPGKPSDTGRADG